MTQQHIYVIDIHREIERFRTYHAGYANPQVPVSLQTEYIHMVVEQMIAHFEVEAVAVESFINHYTLLITDSTVSPLFKYHPLKFLRQMDNAGYQHYLYCLYGFAEEIFRLLQSHGMFNERGIIRASYQHVTQDSLYLIIRPEVSHVFLS
jgi:hypothetical protein